MFNPLKNIGELNELRKQAMELQKALSQIVVTASRGRAQVTMTADMKVQSITVNGEEMRDLKDALNEALEKAQKKAAAKMQEMGGGLGGLLGK